MTLDACVAVQIKANELRNSFMRRYDGPRPTTRLDGGSRAYRHRPRTCTDTRTHDALGSSPVGVIELGSSWEEGGGRSWLRQAVGVKPRRNKSIRCEQIKRTPSSRLARTGNNGGASIFPSGHLRYCSRIDRNKKNKRLYNG